MRSFNRNDGHVKRDGSISSQQDEKLVKKMHIARRHGDRVGSQPVSTARDGKEERRHQCAAIRESTRVRLGRIDAESLDEDAGEDLVKRGVCRSLDLGLGLTSEGDLEDEDVARRDLGGAVDEELGEHMKQKVLE